ncbi:MAG: 1-acyl-sn-glycerol-3-phosphate acyltransferase [Flavobacteriales bacterium]|nr:1-acyl-sn-glycerol-3-phosphate acyltransferase [Flavobacteriales bacterium]
MFLTPFQKKDTRTISEAELLEMVDENKKIYTEFFDPAYLKSIILNICEFFDKYYFRAKFIGFEEIPERNDPKRPLIYASNHSGMAFPWDAMMFGAGFLQMNDFDMKKSVRGLAAPMLSQTKLMQPYLIDDLWKRSGGVDATSLNFETMMHQDDTNVLIYPEGVPGIGKGFNNKYKLQRFSTSFIRMSIKYKTDVIPVSTVNAEYVNPFSYNIEWISSLVNKVGLPFLPLGLSLLLIPLQPWGFYMGFPANLTYVRGKRIKPYEMVNKPFEELTREDLIEVADKVKGVMQADLDAAVEVHGKRPYDWGSFFKTVFSNISKWPYIFPWGWPLLFLEHERQWLKNKGEPVDMKFGFFSWLGWIFKNPRSIWFYIPIIGWIPIVIRSMRD